MTHRTLILTAGALGLVAGLSVLDAHGG